MSILKILSGPLAGILITGIMFYSTDDFLISRMAGICVWMAVWWITEAVSLYITALLPLSLFPLLGIMDMKTVAPLYNNEIIFLFTGGFMIAFSLEKWNLHKRMAHRIILMTGSGPSGLLLGFMISAYFISMWISNIATTMMLLPAVLAVIKTAQEKEDSRQIQQFATALLLGLAYSSSLGGTATLVGTAPNMIFMSFYNEHFPEQPPINFSNWMIYAFPVSLILFFACFLLLKKMFIHPDLKLGIDKKDSLLELQLLGKLRTPEKAVIFIFVCTVLLWFFRADIALPGFLIPGWSNILEAPGFMRDSSIAMLMATLLLLIPDGKGSTLLTWEEVKKIPLGILFLFGGGFALAEGIIETGLSEWLSQKLQLFSGFHPLLIVVLLSLFMTFFTELMSNTAATYLVLPIVFALTQNIDAPPILLLIPVVLSASYAFMLPIATPPNTIIFSTEIIRIKDMVRAGLIMNIIGVIVLALAALIWQV